MAQSVSLAASARTTAGKGSARTLRRQGQVPAVIYGHSRTPEALTVESAALAKTLTQAGHTTIIDLTIDSRAPVKALIREVQRDSLRPVNVLHVDFHEIRADEKIRVKVPVHLTGIPDGVRNSGGVLDHSLRELEIEVLPGDIPASVDLDVTPLAIGHSLFVRDVTPGSFRILNDPAVPVCSVVAPRAEEVVAPVATEEVALPAEPELIRKVRAEDEEETEEKA